FLVRYGVKLEDFGRFADRLTQKIKCHAKKLAKRLGRPYVHVPSAKADKYAIIRRLLADNPIREGLIAVLWCVEPCYSFDVGTNPENGWLELRSRPRQSRPKESK